MIEAPSEAINSAATWPSRATRVSAQQERDNAIDLSSAPKDRGNNNGELIPVCKYAFLSS